VVVSVEYIMQFNESAFFFTNLRYILTGPTINEPPDALFRNDWIDFSCYENLFLIQENRVMEVLYLHIVWENCACETKVQYIMFRF